MPSDPSAAAASAGISQAIASGLALALEQPALLDACRGQAGESISLMRVFRYLPYAEDSRRGRAGERIGSAPHTDWGFLTLVLQQCAPLPPPLLRHPRRRPF